MPHQFVDFIDRLMFFYVSTSLCVIFYLRSNDLVPSTDGIQSPPIQTNDNNLSSSLQVSNTKPNLSPTHQSKDEMNSQQGKRKFSVSQYMEHKRSKPTDTTLNCSADVDMRINTMENLKVNTQNYYFKTFFKTFSLILEFTSNNNDGYRFFKSTQ